MCSPALRVIDEFFLDQNLTLPRGKNWRNVAANVFEVVDGKRILFGNEDALFHRLKSGEPSLELIRAEVAMAMTADEIHADVHQFVSKLRAMTETA